MRVKLLTGRAGPRGVHDPGEVIEVSDEEGRRMIAAGQCVQDGVSRQARKVRGNSAETAATLTHGETRG